VSLRPDGTYRCDRCDVDVGNGAVTEAAVIADLELVDDADVHARPRTCTCAGSPGRAPRTAAPATSSARARSPPTRLEGDHQLMAAPQVDVLAAARQAAYELGGQIADLTIELAAQRAANQQLVARIAELEQQLAEKDDALAAAGGEQPADTEQGDAGAADEPPIA
jgi:hypothetical protein